MVAMMNIETITATSKKKHPASRKREKSRGEISREIAEAFARVAEAYERYDRDKKTLLDEAMETGNPDQHIMDRIVALNSVVEDALYDVYPKIKQLYHDLGFAKDDDDAVDGNA